MSTVKRKCRVVMLPTKEKANIGDICNGYYGLQILSKTHGNTLSNSQHLYILSDDEIKEGDWYHNLDMKTSEYGVCFCNSERLSELSTNAPSCKKIIATTDKSLNLPQPSPQFIDKFIEEYNKSNIITDVMVEYEGYECKNGHYMKFQGVCSYPHCNELNYLMFKVDKNNCITITKVKDSWTREEVHNLLMQAWVYGQANPDCHYEIREKWIEDNL